MAELPGRWVFRELLLVASISTPETGASGEPEDQRQPCPCCGGRMIIIEVFERRMRGDLVEKTLGIKLRKRRLSVAKWQCPRYPGSNFLTGSSTPKKERPRCRQRHLVNPQKTARPVSSPGVGHSAGVQLFKKIPSAGQMGDRGLGYGQLPRFAVRRARCRR